MSPDPSPPRARQPLWLWNGPPTVSQGAGPPLTCSVVIPHHESPDTLALVLEGLARQTHPSTAMEVIVADDGSAPSARPPSPDGLPYTLTHVAQPRQGPRRGQARNLGAQAAHGDVLLFLDSDMVPDRDLVAAHVHAQRSCDYVVGIGDRFHVEDAGGPRRAVAQHLATGRPLQELRPQVRSTVPRWRTTYVRDTRQLTSPQAEGWRVAGGGNLSLRRQLFTEVGGFSGDFSGWGGEDLELAYRAGQAGALFVWLPDALAVHLGLQATPSGAERAQQARTQQLLADRIPDPALRRDHPFRLWHVPRLVLAVDAAGWPDRRAEALIAEVLDRCPDVCVAVAGQAPDAARLLAAGYQGDARVRVGPVDLDGPPLSTAPLRAVVRDPRVTGVQLARAVDALEGAAGTVAAVDLANGGDPPGVRVVLTAVHARVRRCLGPATAGRPADPDDAELDAGLRRFGVRRLPIGPGAATSPLAVAPSGTSHPDAHEMDLALQSLRNAFWRLPRGARVMLLRAVITLRRAVRAVPPVRPLPPARPREEPRWSP